MIFRKLFLIIFFTGAVLQGFTQDNTALHAERGNIRLTFSLDGEGSPRYAVFFKGQQLIAPSRQGFVLAEDSLFYKGFTISGTERKSVNETWKPVWGEVSSIRNSYEQLIVHLKQQHAPGRLLDIVFRVF